MIKLFRAPLDKDELAKKMSERERALLFLLGHAMNEINVINHLLIVVAKGESESEIVNAAETGQTVILARLLIAKTHDAWELFRKRFQSDRLIANKFSAALEKAARPHLEALNKHFGAGSFLTGIRNKVSSHYTDDDNLIERAFQTLPDNEPLHFFISENTGNSFYHASELIASFAMLSLASDKKSGEDGFEAGEIVKITDRLFNTALSVSGEITSLFGACMAILLNGTVGPTKLEPLQIEAPDMQEFHLPFFFDVTKLQGS